MVNTAVTKLTTGECSTGYWQLRCTLISDNGHAICGFLAVRMASAIKLSKRRGKELSQMENERDPKELRF